MVKIYQLTFCIALLLSLQSCYIKRSSNLSFVNRSVAGESAEIVSIKVPLFLVKPFIRKELASQEDELVRHALKKIKSVKITTLSNAEDSPAIQEHFKLFLSREHMEEFASIISDGDRISVNGLMKKDKIKKLLFSVSEEGGDHVFIEVKGNFSLNELSDAITKYEKKKP